MTRVSPTVNAWIADELPPLRASTRETRSPKCFSTHRSVLAGGRRRRKRLRSSSPKPCGGLFGFGEFWLLVPDTFVLLVGLEVEDAHFGTGGGERAEQRQSIERIAADSIYEVGTCPI